MSKQKKINKRHIEAKRAIDIAQGFDFGNQQSAMVVPDLSFIEYLNDANIFGCGYGSDRIDGFPSSFPCLFLIGEKVEPLRRAFEVFQQWGSSEDGDVVDVQIMLKNDGSYWISISPEINRVLHRLVPHHQLIQPIIFNLFWLKKLDSTNPLLLKIEEFCRSRLGPISITAATAIPDPSSEISSVSPILDLPRFIKFELNIYREKEVAADHWMLRLGTSRIKAAPRSAPRGDTLSPEKCRERRRQTIDVAFPVSRERIRRAGLISAVLGIQEAKDLTEEQIEQAAINLILSAELSGGRPHYLGIGANLSDVLWKHIYNRVEVANGKSAVATITPDLVLRQARLDVAAVLSARGTSVKTMKPRSMQAMFLRLGYAGG